MHGAGQTPHGARPNREGVGAGASRTQRVPARRAKLPGRSLEPSSNGRPRGMTVTAVTLYRIRLTGPHPLWPSDSEGSEGLHLSSQGSFGSAQDFGCRLPPLTPAVRLNLQVRIPCDLRFERGSEGLHLFLLKSRIPQGGRGNPITGQGDGRQPCELPNRGECEGSQYSRRSLLLSRIHARSHTSIPGNRDLSLRFEISETGRHKGIKLHPCLQT